MKSKNPKVQDSRSIIASSHLTRREMLQKIMSFIVVFLPVASQAGERRGKGGGRKGKGGGRRGKRVPRIVDPSQIPSYKYRIMSVDRFPALQKEFNNARNNEKLGRNKAYRDQIAPLGLQLPGDFHDAKSIIVMATYAKPMYANFHLDGESYRIMIPFQYYDDDLNSDKLKGIIQKDIIKTTGRRVVDVSQNVPLKLLAARSGLGNYARNSLIYVDGMGSYSLLHAFLTDHTVTDDNWTSLQILNECDQCHACVGSCPTYCISKRSYSVSIDKCLTLYNENHGEFPNYILGSMHNALMGCMKCKSPCPANEGITVLSGNMEDISEEETRKILRGTPDEALLKSLQRKLRNFPATETRDQFPILSRNLKTLIRT